MLWCYEFTHISTIITDTCKFTTPLVNFPRMLYIVWVYHENRDKLESAFRWSFRKRGSYVPAELDESNMKLTHYKINSTDTKGALVAARILSDCRPPDPFHNDVNHTRSVGCTVKLSYHATESLAIGKHRQMCAPPRTAESCVFSVSNSIFINWALYK